MKNPETKVIVLDAESLRPMSFDGDQFCFVESMKLSSTRKTGFKLNIYSRKDAILLIEISNQFRERNNFELNTYRLLLVGTLK